MCSFRRLNVLHIITKLELGGAQQSTLYTISHLNKNKYNLFLISSTDGILVDDALKIPGVKVWLIPTLKREIDPLRDFRTIIKLSKFFKENGIDIVHTHSSKAGILGRWAAKIAGVPIIIHTIHGWSFYNPQNRFMKRFYIFLERRTAKITNRLIAVSRHDIEKGKRAGINGKERYALIRYGIKLKEFIDCKIDINQVKRELSSNSERPIVGMVACLKPQKSPQDFIKAASIVVKELPEVRFLLVGDGVLRGEIEGLISKLGLEKNVALAGWRRDIPQIMSTIDIFVLSSLWEGLPIVFLEAMAAGKPIVATDADGAREIVQDGINGFLVPPGDFVGLAQRIITILKDRDLSREMGEEGRRFLLDNSFDGECMVKKIEKLYDNTH